MYYSTKTYNENSNLSDIRTFFKVPHFKNMWGSLNNRKRIKKDKGKSNNKKIKFTGGIK